MAGVKRQNAQAAQHRGQSQGQSTGAKPACARIVWRSLRCPIRIAVPHAYRQIAEPRRPAGLNSASATPCRSISRPDRLGKTRIGRLPVHGPSQGSGTFLCFAGLPLLSRCFDFDSVTYWYWCFQPLAPEGIRAGRVPVTDTIFLSFGLLSFGHFVRASVVRGAQTIIPSVEFCRLGGGRTVYRFPLFWHARTILSGQFSAALGFGIAFSAEVANSSLAPHGKMEADCFSIAGC
ncbi:hypothetical protein [Szabonella alba]|uniref:Uncharacterized protein n=1 Tax=Szabonella alba TaxID=2804194 RepID=A0A8K0Y225_9RHOB|nr:hypothetical protein [Szabonella alba]MBL4918888.1 hypothetical protein [Szabonella alba]